MTNKKLNYLGLVMFIVVALPYILYAGQENFLLSQLSPTTKINISEQEALFINEYNKIHTEYKEEINNLVKKAQQEIEQYREKNLMGVLIVGIFGGLISYSINNSAFVCLTGSAIGIITEGIYFLYNHPTIASQSKINEIYYTIDQKTIEKLNCHSAALEFYKKLKSDPSLQPSAQDRIKRIKNFN